MYERLNAARRARAQKAQGMLYEFEEMTKNPMEVQTRLLMDLLRKNKDTEYGRRYGFGDISSIEEYQRRVPLTTYDDYADYIARMSEGGERGLLSVDDPIWYNKTSGTVGKPKRIPYTKKMSDWFTRYGLNHETGMLYRELGEDYFGGHCLNLVRCSGSIVRLPDGVPFGPVSEAAIRKFKEGWKHIFATPVQSVFASQGTDTRYLNARYSLCDRELNDIVCTFTGFLLDFCRYVEKNWRLLVKDIELGTIDESVELPEATRRELESELEPDPARASELRAIFEEGFDTPFMPRVWPLLRYVVGSASAGFARYTNEVRDRYLGHDVAFYFRGITASEGSFSVPVNLEAHTSSLIPDSLFYEFISQDVDGEDAEPVTMDRLEVGKRYELVVTNYSGFYRYRMKDVLRVTGFHNATPMIEFLYRVDKTVSLMGEKTTELALREAADRTARECGFLLVDSSVYPDRKEVRYVYIMEIDRVPAGLTEQEVVESLERHLADVNPSYGDKVKSGLIRPARILFSQPETYVLYKDMMLLRGNAVAQLKPVTVINNDLQKNFFFTLVEDFERAKEACPR